MKQFFGVDPFIIGLYNTKMSIKTEHTITLSRQDAIDLVASLTNLTSITASIFNEHEPQSSIADNLGREILRQIIDDGIELPENELRNRTFMLACSDIKIG